MMGKFQDVGVNRDDSAAFPDTGQKATVKISRQVTVLSQVFPL